MPFGVKPPAEFNSFWTEPAFWVMVSSVSATVTKPSRCSWSLLMIVTGDGPSIVERLMREPTTWTVSRRFASRSAASSSEAPADAFWAKAGRLIPRASALSVAMNSGVRAGCFLDCMIRISPFDVVVKAAFVVEDDGHDGPWEEAIRSVKDLL